MKNNYSELVHKYLSNELSAQKLKMFETELKQNSELKRELDFQKQLDKTILDEELENFKLGLDQGYVNLLKDKKRRPRINVVRISLIAASVLVLLTLSIVFVNGSRSNVNDEIFSDYYKARKSTHATRAISKVEKNSLYSSALQKYHSGKYLEAKQSLMYLTLENPDNVAAKFYLGIVFIELKEYQNAIEYFNKIVKSKDYFYLEHADWYKSLCLVKLNKNTEAIKQLRLITNQQGFYQDQAEEILSLLQ